MLEEKSKANALTSGRKRSWGDAFSKASSGRFVAKARECPNGTREEAPWALPLVIGSE